MLAHRYPSSSEVVDWLQEPKNPTAESLSPEIQPTLAEGGDALRDSLLEDLQLQLQVGEDGEEPPSTLDKSGVEEYSMLLQEKERLLKENPLASQRTKEQKAQLKKIYNRLGKLSKQSDRGKAKPVTVSADGFNSEEQRDLLSPQNGVNKNQRRGHELKR